MAELGMVVAQLRLDVGNALTGFDGGGAGHGAQNRFTAWFRVAPIVVHHQWRIEMEGLPG